MICFFKGLIPIFSSLTLPPFVGSKSLWPVPGTRMPQTALYHFPVISLPGRQSCKVFISLGILYPSVSEKVLKCHSSSDSTCNIPAWAAGLRKHTLRYVWVFCTPPVSCTLAQVLFKWVSPPLLQTKEE